MLKRTPLLGVVIGLVPPALAEPPDHAAPAALIRSIDPPAGPGAFAPNLAVAGGSIWVSWLEPTGPGDDGRRHRLRCSRLHGDAWQPAGTIAERDDFFANWADVPSIAGSAGGDLVAHWPQKCGPATFAYDVMLATSSDDGATWRVLGTPHRDGTPTEHGFVSMVAEGDGVRAFWLDGRNMDEAASGPDGEPLPPDMTVRTALVGATIGPARVLDERVCECCNTSAAMTAEGPILAYRDRSADEIRDIAVVRRVDDAWSAPALVHADGWALAGCPVNGPALDARGRQVVVAWYTGAVPYGAVRAAFSADCGATFGPPVVVDDHLPVGRVDALFTADGQALVLWIGKELDGAAIRLRSVRPGGGMGPVVTVASSSKARASGFPRMVRLDRRLLVAWTEVGARGEVEGLRAAAIDLATFPAAGADAPSPLPVGLDPDR